MRTPLKIVLSVSLAIGFLAIVTGWAQKALQPIRYNHKKHVEELGMECLDCHKYAETLASASIPNIDVCADCHDDAETENAEQNKVAEYVLNGKRIPWLQVHKVRDYAYFSHRRHVAIAEIECTTCHGEVQQMEAPFEKPFFPDRRDKMTWCMDCHEERGANNDCYACHR